MTLPSTIDMSLIALIPGWFPAPTGLDEIVKRYGKIDIGGGAVLTKGWEAKHLITAREPWMPRGRLYVNRQVWPSLKAAFEACIALNDGYRIRSLGCFSPRLKRVNGDLSTHSWGIAVDLNESTNPLSYDGKLRTDIPDAWIRQFEVRGWTWGGRWSRPDAMHFQYARSY